MTTINPNDVAGLYYEFSIPLGLSSLLQIVSSTTQSDPNTPQIPVQRSPREWFSQPRPGTDTTTEVLNVNFKHAVPVGHLAFQVLRTPCTISVWYQDRHRNWIPLTDGSSNAISLNITYSATNNWYTYQTEVYPVLATALQFRFQRTKDKQTGNQPYVVGLKETLIRNNVYSPHDTTQAIPDQQDILGNFISSHVKHWNPNNVIDNNPSTFWKSFPCPDPNGIVCLYLDTRGPDGTPQLIDTIYIDPVYSGNILNLYYSNDPTPSTLVVSPLNIPPEIQASTTWTGGVGLVDTTGPDLPDSQYLCPSAFGPMLEEAAWIGIEWTPNFSPDSPPASNPVLFQVNPGANTVQTITVPPGIIDGTFKLGLAGTDAYTDPIAYDATTAALLSALEDLDGIGVGDVLVTGNPGGPWSVVFQGALSLQDVPALITSTSLVGGTNLRLSVEVNVVGFAAPNPENLLYSPTIYYDVGAGQITLEFDNGVDPVSYNLALSPALEQGVPLQIVAGWTYNPSTVYLSVTSQNSTSLGLETITATDLPSFVNLDGQTGYYNFCGTMTSLVVKREVWTTSSPAFQANATVYSNPNPVQPDSNGNYPSTSLDNAILAVDWTSQQFPIGGTHPSWYANKNWTPIFANYITQKGNLFLPQKIAMSYLLLEITNLTPEPYPVYDQGISLPYSIFPPSAIQYMGNRTPGILTLGNDIQTNTIGSVNWLNPSTIQNAINSNWGRTQQPVPVVTGPGTTSTSLPNTAQSNINNSYRSEMSNPWIYNRTLPDPAYLAGQQLTQMSNSPNSDQTMQGATDGSTSVQVAGSFTPITTTSRSNVLPVQGQDWWLFPGANMKMPASVMRALTGTSTVTARAPALGIRNRFLTTCVHNYNRATATLDAPLAYFAGFAEVQTYVTSYVASNDPPSFAYNQYDPNTFVYTNILQLTSGPLTTSGSPYVFVNPSFQHPLELEPWTATGDWYWDSQNGPGSQNSLGDVPAAAIVADGNPNTLVSEPLEVNPGDQIIVTAVVAYYGAVTSSPDAGGELSISGVIYDGEDEVGTVTFAMPTTTSTYAVANQASMLALSATVDQSCTITTGQYQGTYTLINTPASDFDNWTFTGYGTLVSSPTGDIDGWYFIKLVGTYTVPGSGVDHLAVSYNVNDTMTAGTVYWGKVAMDPATGVEGTVYLNAVTTSTFANVAVKVSDSGLVESDSMWARLDPLATHIDNLRLTPYVNTIPRNIPAGMWADWTAEWADPEVDWGSPRGLVAITIDPNLLYKGNRAVHFSRASGAGEAGLSVLQQTNMVPQGLARLGCVFLKPNTNSNQITLSLRRVSDGVYVYTETFTPTVIGTWYTYQTSFFELPDSYDQVYTLEMVTIGDSADELYVTKMFTSVAGIRYFVQLGGSGQPLLDITPLAHGENCNISCTDPVNEMALTVGVFSDRAFAYGIELTPRYLR